MLLMCEAHTRVAAYVVEASGFASGAVCDASGLWVAVELMGAGVVSIEMGSVQVGKQLKERRFRTCGWCGGWGSRNGVRWAVERAVTGGPEPSSADERTIATRRKYTKQVFQ